MKIKTLFLCLFLLLPVPAKAMNLTVEEFNELASYYQPQEQKLGAITYRFWNMVNGTTLQPNSADWLIAFNNNVTINGDLEVTGTLTATLAANSAAGTPFVVHNAGTGSTTIDVIASTYLTTFTTNGNATSSPALVMTTGNRIGVSTTTPWAYLSVEGQGTNPAFAVSDTSNNTDFIVDASGNVGIGTSNPSTILDIVGTSTATFTVTAGESASAILILNADQNDDNADSWRIWSVQSDNTLKMDSYSTGAWVNQMTLDGSGNVGIGNTAPGNELEVSISDDNPIIEISAWATSNVQRGQLNFQKSSSATINTLAETAVDEDLGLIRALGVHTGSASANAAQILFEQDAAADADAVPGRISFLTSDATSLKESFRVDDSQNLLIADTNGLVVGAQAQQSIGTVTSEVQVLGTTGDDASISFGRWSADTSEPSIRFYKSRNGTIGSNTAVTTGDNLGLLVAYGDDGTDDDTVSSGIRFDTEGTIGTGQIPGVISFSTADSAGSLTEAMRIDSSQNIMVGDTNGLVIGAQAQQSAGEVTGELQILGTASADTTITVGKWSADGGAGNLRFYKSRDGTIGGNTAVTAGDDLGQISGYGDDGTDDDTKSSSIIFDTEGTIGTGQIPGVIAFGTANSAGTITEAMRINSSQNVGVGTSTPEVKFVVSEGASATTTIQHGTLGASVGTCYNIFAVDGTALRKYYLADTTEVIEAGTCQ